MLILLVEDDALIAMSLEAALSDAGHSVRGPASTACPALQLAEFHPPELALVNINLRDGHGSGIELARELHRRWAVPSIFVSGQRHEAFAAREVAIGYIGKPYDPDTVLKAVEVARLVKQGRLPPREMIPQRLELFVQPTES